MLSSLFNVGLGFLGLFTERERGRELLMRCASCLKQIKEKKQSNRRRQQRLR